MNRLCYSVFVASLAMVGCGSDSDSSSTKDVESPTLSNITPTNSMHTKTAAVSIGGNVADNEAVHSVSVTYAGKTVDATVDNGTFSADITLSAGSNTIEIVATDNAGNTQTETRIVVLDADQPTLSMVFPANGHSTQALVTTIRIHAEDNQSVDSVKVVMGDQDITASMVGNQYQARLKLAPGNNSYTVTATDAAGNEVSETHTAYFGKQVMGGNSHSGAIRPDGLYTWGRNNYGQTALGFTSRLGEDQHPNAPVKVETDINFISVAFGQNVSTGLSSDGSVWAWGYGKYGQLGQGSADTEFNQEHSSTPLQVGGITDAVAVTRGYNQTLVLHADGTISTFGRNNYGQLGDGTTEDRDMPVKPALTNIIQIASGSYFSVAVDADGRVWSWGRNSDGQLGLGTMDTDAHPTPTQVSINEPIEAVVTGKAHALALARSGAVYGWGLNYNSQIGMFDKDNVLPDWPSEITSPKKLPWFSDAVAVWANGNQSFAERQDGRVYPWGQNGLGMLGVELNGNVQTPSSPVFGFDKVVDLGNGALHTVGLRQDGSVFSWGWSFEGSLGGGQSTINRWAYRVPTLVMPSVQL